MKKPVFAAGTVCYRRAQVDGVERLLVLLVHRTKQRDVSFPKGKLDKGESMPHAAVRETSEETGLSVTLGVAVGTIHYTLPSGAKKTVQYWAAEVTEQAAHNSTFKPNREIAALEWVPVEEVASKLSYEADRRLFTVFTDLVARDAIDSFAVILLRHAKAEPRSALYSEDRLRPLAAAGEKQSQNLVSMLLAFGPGRILSSNAERCLQTVEPFAEHLGKQIKEHDALSQDAWDAGETDGLRTIIGKVVRRGKSVVLCSHRPVLPDVARELALATGSLPGDYLRKATELPTGGFSVFHLSKKHPGSGILCVETYPLKH